MILTTDLIIMLVCAMGIGAVGFRIAQLTYWHYIDMKERAAEIRQRREDERLRFKLEPKQAYKWEEHQDE